jgi:biotin transport system substrate-specific component
MGMASIPVFAPGGSALPQGTWGVHFILPWRGTDALPWDISSGGYIVGFILAAYVAGHFAQRAWDRKPWGILAMLGGNAVLYVPGLLWLYYLIATDWVPAGASKPLGEFIAGSGSWGKTLGGGLYPFIVGDLMKLYLATLALPSAWALVNRLKGGGSRPPGA